MRSMPSILLALALSISFGQANSNEAEREVRSEVARLKQAWKLHPGPLMVDAVHWLPSLFVLNGDEVIVEPDLSIVAQTSMRRHVRVGRADVIARRLEGNPLLASGVNHSLMAFASQRADALSQGLPLNQLNADERDLWMNLGNQYPGFIHALKEGSSAPLFLKPRFEWIDNGQPRTVLAGMMVIHEQKVSPPSARPPWAEPRQKVSPSAVVLDFGEGRLMTTRLMLAKLHELGYSVRYDARLEDAEVFLKGEFEVNEFLEAARELLRTVPFTSQDMRSQKEQSPARYRELLMAALIKEGFPQELAERLDESFAITASRAEFRAVPMFKDRMGDPTQDTNESIKMNCLLRFICDPGVTWMTQRADGYGSTYGPLSIAFLPP